jgi:hypothetical protein
MKRHLRLKLLYTDVARSVVNGVPVIAMQHRAKDLMDRPHATEWIYMEPCDAETLVKTLQEVLASRESAPS